MALVVWLDPGGRVYHAAGCLTLAEKTPVVPYVPQRDGWREPCRHCKPEVPERVPVVLFTSPPCKGAADK